ncbi:hypothetical protein V1512DRAFT_244991 [Lipomyces arxii]|uniref:uncharacterized protein n=1 Tax=Lipomyces arxii TaxID=56418 RepID=UPI0034CDA739
MASFYKWYNTRLAARPILTQCVSTGVLFGIGDAVAQTMVPDEKLNGKYDYMRTARMCFHGGVVFAPLVSQWYRLINTRIVIPGRPTAEAFARMVVDQTVWAPFGIASFYVSMGVLSNQGWDVIKQDLQNKWYPTMVGNYAVWPAVQIINFRFLPLEYRLLFVNVVSIAWNAFLSYFNAVESPLVEL